MRTVSWETSVGALAALLNSSTQVRMIDLLTITLSGGSVVRYTSDDLATVVNGNTFALGPLIKRGKTRLIVGIEVDELDFTFHCDSTVTINGVVLLKFLIGGGFDGARIKLERAFSSAPGAAWTGTLSIFTGRVSVVNVSRYEAHVTVSSDIELLNAMVPRNVYQPGCSNTLFDSSCGLLKATYAVTGTATSTTDSTKTVFSTGLAQAGGYFSLGWAVGLAGANAGVGRTIKNFSSGVIITIQPWPSAVGIGDTFTVYPGCDKLQTTCNSKFGNLARFRGQPYVPAPETVT